MNVDTISIAVMPQNWVIVERYSLIQLYCKTLSTYSDQRTCVSRLTYITRLQGALLVSVSAL